MSGFSEARKELSDAGNKKDAAMLNGLSIVAYLARNHWDVAAGILAYRYFYQDINDFEGLMNWFNGAIEQIA